MFKKNYRVVAIKYNGNISHYEVEVQNRITKRWKLHKSYYDFIVKSVCISKYKTKEKAIIEIERINGALNRVPVYTSKKEL